MGLGNPLMNAVDGLRNPRPMLDLLVQRAELRVVHGHIHRRIDKHLERRTHPQVFAARAARDGEDLVRFYHAEGGELQPMPPLGPADGDGGAHAPVGPALVAPTA
jgi:hypothetical protein